MSLAKAYAHALYDLQKGVSLSSDAAVSKLIKVLKNKGHIKLLPSIVSEYENILNTGRDKNTMSISCARESDFQKYEDQIKEHLGYIKAEFTEELLDETLVGGYVLQRGETVVDGSYKKKLLLLYQSAIA